MTELFLILILFQPVRSLVWHDQTITLSRPTRPARPSSDQGIILSRPMRGTRY